MHDDSMALTEAAARGDRAAVDALLVRYLPELRAFIRLRSDPVVRAQESSSDLAQSVCREALDHLDRFRFGGEKAFKRWLFTEALRKVRKRARYHRADCRDARRRAEYVEAGAQDGLAECYRGFSSASGRAMRREQVEQVEAAFDRLSDEQREVVTLAHVVGLSRAEIGELTGRSEGAVRVMLHRALARLAAMLDPGAAGDE